MENGKIKLAIIGTQGIPNQYGGFESLVEHIAKYLSGQFDITIFCSSKVYSEKLPEVYGCRLRYLPFKANGVQSIPYDIISILQSVKKYDRILILGSSGGVILPLLKKYRHKLILNLGGMDWKRSKWSRFAKSFLKLSESLAVKNCGDLVADNACIQQYIKQEYKRQSVLIEYGGDHVTNEIINERDTEKYPFLKNKYALSVARIQPDNNIEMILDAFREDAPVPIVFIGNWNGSSYGEEIKKKYSGLNNIILLDAIYDQKELNKIRSNCAVYIHGHSAGGTNPSLVEAMCLGLPIICYASGFNQSNTEHKALYFKDGPELRNLLDTDNAKLLKLGSDMKAIAERRYKWQMIAQKYADCIKGDGKSSLN